MLKVSIGSLLIGLSVLFWVLWNINDSKWIPFELGRTGFYLFLAVSVITFVLAMVRTKRQRLFKSL